jgi:hypothetical protein
MPYACSYDVPADEATYRRIRSEIGDVQPAGLIAHLVVTSEVGLRHFQVWETKEDWERFRDGAVLPAVGNVLTAMGFEQLPPPAVEEEMNVIDVSIGGAIGT